MVLCMVIAFIAVLINTIVNFNPQKQGVAFAYASGVYFTYLFLITEVLSAFHAIKIIPLVVAWTLFAVVNLVLCGLGIRKHGITFSFKLRKAGVVFLLFSISVFLIALCTAPYNYDAMCYHLPRLVQWAKNASVMHFAAGDIRQISSPVFAEYIQLHFYVLAGKTDALLTVPQALTFLGAGYLVYCIAKFLGSSDTFALLSGMLYLSLPIAFAEAMSVQNDDITSFFFICFLLVTIDFIYNKEDKYFYAKILLSGLLAGLAILSKYYVLFPIAIVYVWTLIAYIKDRIQIKKIVASVSIIAISVISVMAPELVRQYKTFGVLAHYSVSDGQIIKTLDLRIYIITFFKNFVFNLANNYVVRTKGYMLDFVAWLTKLLGVEPTNPLVDIKGYDINGAYIYHQDLAQCTIATWLFLLMIGILIYRLIRKKKTKNIGYIICGILSFIIFLSIMQYTHHRTRYEIAFFGFLIPAIMSVLEQSIGESIKWKYSLISIICCLSFFELCNMYGYHYEIARDSDWGKRPGGYFQLTKIEYIYDEIADFLKENDCRLVGINVTGAVWEYPLWTMIDADEIRPVNITNVTKKYERIDWNPDCIIYMNNEHPYSVGETVEYNGYTYTFVKTNVETYHKYQIAIREK